LFKKIILLYQVSLIGIAYSIIVVEINS